MEVVSPSVLGAGRILWTLLGASLLALATNANYLQKKAMYYRSTSFLYHIPFLLRKGPNQVPTFFNALRSVQKYFFGVEKGGGFYECLALLKFADQQGNWQTIVNIQVDPQTVRAFPSLSSRNL